MNTAADTDFVVGENYENEKGIFTVISMDRKEMVIRWESGEEISTDIDLQRNIQARRRWEQLQRENAAKAAKGGSRAGKAKAEFNGFQAGDFKNSASGTKWRGRVQLGGAVTRRLPDKRLNFNSWAFANKPELHWRDVDHRGREGAEQGAWMVVRVDRMSLFYGFGIVRPDDKDGTSRDWETFIEWVDYADNEELLHKLAVDNDLTVCERTGSDTVTLQPQKSGWRTEQDAYKTLADYCKTLPPTGPLHIEMTKRIEKIDAVARGKKVADEIASLMTTILPVYIASLGITE